MRALKAKIQAILNFHIQRYFRPHWALLPIYGARTLQLMDPLAGSQPDTVIWTDAMRKEYEDNEISSHRIYVLHSAKFWLLLKFLMDPSIRDWWMDLTGAVIFGGQIEKKCGFLLKKINKS